MHTEIKTTKIMKEVEKHIGYAYYDENNEIAFVKLGGTENGFCYKDMDARGDEICYVPEMSADVALVDEEGRLNLKDDEFDTPVYTFNDVLRAVKDIAKEAGYEATDAEVEEIALFVLEEVDWEAIETYLFCDFDFDAWFDEKK